MRALILCLLLGVQTRSFSHEGSVSFLWLTNSTESCAGEWHVALKDLDLHLGLDQDQNGSLTWGEVRRRLPEIEDLWLRSLHLFAGEKRCEPRLLDCLIERHSATAYLVLRFHAPAPLDHLNYSFHFEMDSSHRVILQCADATRVLSATQRSASLEAPASWLSFLKEGAFHIWSGPDHILFLFALLLPVCLAGRARSSTSGLASAWTVGKIVTAFTVAHSITLALAVLHWANPPARFVETLIAFSVLLAALNNLRPFWNDKGWVIAFAFGLVHGFGFAGPLLDAQLSRAALVPALALFNLGVELGQALIVAVALPILLFINTRELLRARVLRGACVLIAGFACLWLLERGFNLAIFAT